MIFAKERGVGFLKPQRFSLHVIISPLLLLSSPYAYAGDFTVNAQIVERFSLDDNIQQSDDGSDVIFGSTSILQTNVNYLNPTFDLNYDSNLDYRRFFGGDADDDDLNGLDQVHRFGLVKRLKNLQFTANGSLGFESTVFNEFEDSGILSEQETTRQRRTLNGAASYSINERSTATINAGVNSVDFSESSTTLSPFISINAGGSFAHRLTRRLELTVAGDWSLFDSDGLSGNTSRTFEATTGANISLTKRLTANAGVGVSFINNETTVAATPVSTNSVVSSFNLGADYTTPRTSYGVSFNRSTDPSTLGELQTRNALALSLSHRLNSRSSFGLSLSAQTQAGVGESDSDRDSLSFGTTYSRSITESWQANVGYNLRVQDSANIVTTSNSIFMSFTKDIDIRP